MWCFVSLQRRFWSRLTTCIAVQRLRNSTSCYCSTRTGKESLHFTNHICLSSVLLSLDCSLLWNGHQQLSICNQTSISIKDRRIVRQEINASLRYVLRRLFCDSTTRWHQSQWIKLGFYCHWHSIVSAVTFYVNVISWAKLQIIGWYYVNISTDYLTRKY